MPATDPQTPLPIFIHSSFRTSSTWIWSKFRRLPNTIAYYEIFHAILETMTAESICALRSSSWSSRHPPLAPYFLEFLPLVKPGGGIVGHESIMELGCFIPDEGLRGELSPQEKAYLQLLVQQACKGRKIPVLSCTRSLGRVAAIKRFMKVKNVLIHRNLFHQWASYSGLALEGESYFLKTVDATLKACRHDEFLSMLDAAFTPRASTPQDEQTFAVFLLMHLYLYAHAIEAADVVVDTTALVTDLDLRRSLEDELSRLVLGPIDLSDARLGFEISVMTVSDRPHFVDKIEQFTKLITSTCSSQRAADFVVRLKDEAMGEWDRHDSLTRRSIAWHRRETDALQFRIEKHDAGRLTSEAAAAALSAERDGLAARVSALTVAHETSEAAGAALSAERDSLAARVSELTASLEEARSAVASLTTEREWLVGQLDIASTAPDSAASAEAANGTHDRAGPGTAAAAGRGRLFAWRSGRPRAE